ncbi:MAG: hypothetical protein LBV17_12060 [Treponema sp.]|jgi:hypothetical protein|nr:hypothetical protein [Treponema sp.]
MKYDSGAIEFNAVLLLFFIAIVISSGALYTAGGITYLQTDKHDFDNKIAADTLLDTIINEMQALSLSPYDDYNNTIITGLCQKYNNYGLEFTDVSSGYHLDFLSDEDMADNNITQYLFRDNTGSGFTAWRNTNGLSVSKAPWREFIKDEAWTSCVSYGWVHKDNTESFAYRSISKSFAVTAPDKLFPLVNAFPRMNINMINPDMLRPLIMRSSFKIEKPKEKADDLISRLRNDPVLYADISSILKIPASHPLMGYLGTKTAFWKLRFVMRPSLTVEAVVAAIPLKNGSVQEIEAYRLIDRSFIDD